MSNPTTADRVKTLISDHLNRDPERVVEEAKLVDDLGADSLDFVELTMAAEEEFKIEITDEMAAKSINDQSTVLAFIQLVEGLVPAKV